MYSAKNQKKEQSSATRAEQRYKILFVVSAELKFLVMQNFAVPVEVKPAIIPHFQLQTNMRLKPRYLKAKESL